MWKGTTYMELQMYRVKY